MNQASAQNKYCTQLTYFPVQTKLEPGNAGKFTEEKVQNMAITHQSWKRFGRPENCFTRQADQQQL